MVFTVYNESVSERYGSLSNHSLVPCMGALSLSPSSVVAFGSSVGGGLITAWTDGKTCC